jgi:hypothetical protein
MKRELLEESEMQKKLEKSETEGAALRRDLNEARLARKQLEMENDIELGRLRNNVSRLEQELEFTKSFNDQGRKHDKAIQDLKDIHCAGWKMAAEEAQKQLQSALQVVTKNSADDTAKKARSLAPLIASTCNSMVVSPTSVGGAAFKFCLITPPIAPGIDKSEMAIASVKFTIQSHDQGWTMGQPGTSSSLPSKQQVECIPQAPMWARRLRFRQLLFATAIQI